MTRDRTYQTTHPWIRFAADLSRAPWDFWARLGECQSKCAHIAQVPLRPATANELRKVYLVKGARASAAIEGNTLAEEEIRRHIDGEARIPKSREYLAREVENIIDACNKMVQRLGHGQPLELTHTRIRELNIAVLNNTEYEDWVEPGEIPTQSIGVANYRGAPRGDCVYLLDRLCQWVESPEMRGPSDEWRIAFAVIRAVLAHLYIAWIHPFSDGNGRTARLIEFQILISSDVPAPAAHLLSNHYNLTRHRYYRELDRATQSGGDVTGFLQYAVGGLLDGLRQQLDVIWEQQFDIAWRNFVHERPEFRDKSSAPARRQRRLLLDLSVRRDPVPLAGIPELTPAVARYYAKVSERTLLRDLKALEKMGLVGKVEAGYRAMKELILSFQPPVASPAR